VENETTLGTIFIANTNVAQTNGLIHTKMQSLQCKGERAVGSSIWTFEMIREPTTAQKRNKKTATGLWQERTSVRENRIQNQTTVITLYI